MNLKAATGSGLLLALGKERAYNIPGSGGLLAYRAILPGNMEVGASESPSAQVNRSGFVERGLPGPRGGDATLGLPLSSGLLLEFFENLLGSCSRAVLEAGPPPVYRYLAVPTLEGVDTSMFGLQSNSVDRHWVYGIKWSKLEMEVGDNEEIPVRIDGQVSHGTRLGLCVPEAANTGTYLLGPHLRGPLRDPAAGDVWIKVTGVAPLTFRVQQGAALPAFAGPDVPVLIDPISGEGTWQNLQGHDGVDLGYFAENKDPLEGIFPGAPADHQTLAVGDVFRAAAPGTWQAPAVPNLGGFARFTSAHWVVRLRTQGGVWQEKNVRSGKVGFEWALSAERGNGSRYPYALLREGQLLPTLELSRALVDSFFSSRMEASDRIEAELRFEGRQLGTGVHREGLVFAYPSLRIDERDSAPSDEGITEETVTLVGETNDDGDAPVTVQVTTTRDWTPTPLP